MYRQRSLKLIALVGILAAITFATHAVYTVSEPPAGLRVPNNEIKTDWVTLPVGNRQLSFGAVVYPDPAESDMWVTLGGNHAGVKPIVSDSLLQGVAGSANKSGNLAYDCAQRVPLGQIVGVRHLHQPSSILQ
jgi:hypothetical protein